MKRGIEALVLTIALALAAGCAETAQEGEPGEEPADTTAAGPETPDQIRSSVESANAAFVEAVAAGDVAGAARGIYTEDATIYPPGAEPVEGRDAIVEFWTGAAAQLGVTGIDLTTVEVEPAGPGMAWETGEFRILGAEGPLDEGSYVVVWKSTPDGWKWHRDMWNSDGAVGGGAEGETAPAGADSAATVTG